MAGARLLKRVDVLDRKVRSRGSCCVPSGKDSALHARTVSPFGRDLGGQRGRGFGGGNELFGPQIPSEDEAVYATLATPAGIPTQA